MRRPVPVQPGAAPVSHIAATVVGPPMTKPYQSPSLLPVMKPWPSSPRFRNDAVVVVLFGSAVSSARPRPGIGITTVRTE